MISGRMTIEQVEQQVDQLAFLGNAAATNIRLIAPPPFVGEVDSAIRKRVFDGRMVLDEARKANLLVNQWFASGHN